MTPSCLSPEDLPGALDLPADDPRRRHLDACPHCRALAHAYAEFMTPTPDADDDALADAEAELAHRLARTTGVEPTSPRRPRPRALRTPVLMAAAAVLMLCAGIFLVDDLTRLRDARVPEGLGELRGAAPADGPRWVETDDGWRLVWKGMPPGRPVVVFFDTAMQEVGRRVLPEAATPLLAPSDAPTSAIYLRVLAVAQADTVARSELVAARPPGD